MSRRGLLSALLCLGFSQAGHAEPECVRPAYVWELELVEVQRLTGDSDLSELPAALGTRAVLRGGTRDPGASHISTAQLLGSSDGAGLRVSLEKQRP